MTEKQFWNLIRKVQTRNRPKLLAAGLIRPNNHGELEAAKRLYGKSYTLDNTLEDLTTAQLKNAAKLIFIKETSLKCKEIIIMTLAHKCNRFALNMLKKYNKVPDKELKHFAEFALEECKWWNE